MGDLSEPMTAADPSRHRQELTERLDTLRRNDSFCDVTIAVKGEEFKAHKDVLAASSPFFLSLLESGMRESTEQLIRIELEEATAAVMEGVLKYIYTGNVLVTGESGHNLIATADYLLLPGLKTVAGNFTKDTVTIENCVFNYYFAIKYQCPELRQKSSDLIRSNFSVVMETDDFLNLETNQVMEWVSSNDVIVKDEEDIFKGIVKWVNHNKTERERSFPDLFQEVRLLSLSHKFLFNELVKDELVRNSNECLNFVLAGMKGIVLPSDSECVPKSARKCLETHTDVIFVTGGIMSFCYVPSEDIWYQLDDMIFDHKDHGVIQFGDKVFIFSPNNAKHRENIDNVTEYYSSSSNSWGAISHSVSCFRRGLSSVLKLNDCIYILEVDDVTYKEDSIHQYYPEDNFWELFWLPLDRWGTCDVSDVQHLYIIGGTNSGEAINGTCSVARFGPEGFETVAGMNEARHNAFGAAMNGKIYVAGGLQRKERGCKVLCTCEVYSPSTDEWQVIASLNVPRHSTSMLCFKGGLYIVGGLRDNKRSRELSVEMFYVEENEWKKKSNIPVTCEHVGEDGKKPLYKACFANLHRSVLSELNTLESKISRDAVRAQMRVWLQGFNS
ncbi:kelch-like protein 12 [Orbicella faveolata]|uniref:kelch-like protein 12 n=1 Tax=Orbicella faveolata TaxID=48498 RepID=UPI0009E5E3CB|nr:kelch-like protein 12 [Orbicella faveolata]